MGKTTLFGYASLEEGTGEALKLDQLSVSSVEEQSVEQIKLMAGLLRKKQPFHQPGSQFLDSLICFGKWKSIEERERPESEGYQSHIHQLWSLLFFIILVIMVTGNDANHDVRTCIFLVLATNMKTVVYIKIWLIHLSTKLVA